MLWSMIKILIFVAIAAALAFGFAWVIEQPGEVVVAFAGREWSLTPIGSLIALGIILVVVGAVLYLVGTTGRAIGGRRHLPSPLVLRLDLVEGLVEEIRLAIDLEVAVDGLGDLLVAGGNRIVAEVRSGRGAGGLLLTLVGPDGEPFAASGRFAISIDLRGHGHSDCCARGDCHHPVSHITPPGPRASDIVHPASIARPLRRDAVQVRLSTCQDACLSEIG